MLLYHTQEKLKYQRIYKEFESMKASMEEKWRGVKSTAEHSKTLEQQNQQLKRTAVETQKQLAALRNQVSEQEQLLLQANERAQPMQAQLAHANEVKVQLEQKLEKMQKRIDVHKRQSMDTILALQTHARTNVAVSTPLVDPESPASLHANPNQSTSSHGGSPRRPTERSSLSSSPFKTPPKPQGHGLLLSSSGQRPASPFKRTPDGVPSPSSVRRALTPSSLQSPIAINQPENDSHLDLYEVYLKDKTHDLREFDLYVCTKAGEVKLYEALLGRGPGVDKLIKKIQLSGLGAHTHEKKKKKKKKTKQEKVLEADGREAITQLMNTRRTGKSSKFPGAVSSFKWLMVVIWQVFNKKLEFDECDDRVGNEHGTFPDALYLLFLMQSGVDGDKTAMQTFAWTVIKTAYFFRDQHPIVELFFQFLEESHNADVVSFCLAIYSFCFTAPTGVDYLKTHLPGRAVYICTLRTHWVNRVMFNAFGQEVRVCACLCVCECV
jgi:hypothetical protein